MSTIDANLLSTWLTKGKCDAGHPVKLLFTTMPSGTYSKNASSVDTNNKLIPNSLFFDFQGAFAEANSNLSNTMCSGEQFQKEARKLGINHNDTLVVYDNFGNFCASRVWFMCKSMGCKHVYLLNGGLAKWISLGFDVVDTDCLQSSNNKDEGNFVVEPDPRFQFIDKTSIIPIAEQNPESLKNAKLDPLIIDARGPKRFSGESPDPRPNVRSGHIPHSVNLPYCQLQDDWGGFLPKNELLALFEQKQAVDLKSLIFSCGSGVTACIVAQAAFILGISPLKVYDGSWSEWGAIPELPIQTSTLNHTLQ